MSRNPRMDKMRSSAAAILRTQKALEKSATDWARPGWSPNVFGQYWKDEDVSNCVALLESILLEDEDESERNASEYRLAALLYSALRLDSAATVCKRADDGRSNSIMFRGMLARIEARRGNLGAALALAQDVNSASTMRFTQVDASELHELAAKSGSVV